MFIAAEREVVPEEAPNGMMFQFISFCSGNGSMRSSGEEDLCFLLMDRLVRQMFDPFSVQSLGNLADRDIECLAVTGNFIVIVTMEPADIEADVVAGTCDSAVVQQISFDEAAFGTIIG